MKFDDVMMLIRAGYTKNEIQEMEMANVVTDPEPAPEPKEPAPEPAPEPAEPIPTLENGQQLDNVMQTLANMIQQNQQLLQSMQAANIQAARMPEDKKESPEDLIAKIIAPGPTSGKGGK